MKEYIIKKGDHRSTFSWKPTTDSYFHIRAILDDSCKYVLDKNNQEAINKLFGFSDGCLNHHKNSFRFGWNYSVEKDEIQYFAYIYVDGIRSSYYLGSEKTNKIVYFTLKFQEDTYFVTFNKKPFEFKRSKNIRWKYKHALYPYFGGVKTAPHDMSLVIKYW